MQEHSIVVRKKFKSIYVFGIVLLLKVYTWRVNIKGVPMTIIKSIHVLITEKLKFNNNNNNKNNNNNNNNNNNPFRAFGGRTVC
jgi:hypothetical protein